MATASRTRASSKKTRSEPRRGFQRILVPLDFSKRDPAVLETALLVASASGATTTLFHVVYVPDELSLRDLRDFYRELAERGHAKLVRYARQFKSKGLEVEVEVASGRPLDEVLAFARSDATDLIVLSSHSVEPEHRDPGWNTLSYKIAALCSCPVLLAK